MERRSPIVSLPHTLTAKYSPEPRGCPLGSGSMLYLFLAIYHHRELVSNFLTLCRKGALMYIVFYLISRLVLAVGALIALFLVLYPCWLGYSYFTSVGFYAPIKMKEYSGFCAFLVLSIVVYLVAESIALHFKEDDNDNS